MGRPLNKKYFGNRNIGTASTTDNKIGGEGLAAYTLPVQLGSLIINNAYAQPILVVPAPTIPGGVQATASVVWEVESIVVSNGLAGNGYVTTTGGATTLTGLAGVTANITAVGSGQGEVQTIVPVNRGSFTSIPVVAGTYQIVGGDGNNQANVKYRVKTITTVVAGSGYTGTETFSWDDDGSHSGTMPGVPTVALTADTGLIGSLTNQENAIIAYGWSGSAPEVVDIVRQVSGRRYKIKGNAGGLTRSAVLVDHAVTGVNQASITAYDSDNNEYWVTKLTAHLARVTRKSSGSGQFASGTSVQWTFGSAQEDYSVKLQNA